MYYIAIEVANAFIGRIKCRCSCKIRWRLADVRGRQLRVTTRPRIQFACNRRIRLDLDINPLETIVRQLTYSTMTIRRQLSMYVPVAEGVEVESVRRKLDPVQATLIPAHVTLCRDEEIAQLSPSDFEARLSRSGAKPLILTFGPPVTFEGHGILLPCTTGEREFHELRAHVLGKTVIHRHSPHITLAHPRNPPPSDWAFSEAVKTLSTCSFTFAAINFIEQLGAATWRVVREFKLTSRSEGSH